MVFVPAGVEARGAEEVAFSPLVSPLGNLNSTLHLLQDLSQTDNKSQEP